MLIIPQQNYVKCIFDLKCKSSSSLREYKVDIYYSETEDLRHFYSYLENNISVDEQLRAEKFLFDKDRETYITCHGLLRLVLAQNLQCTSLGISFKRGLNNKPSLEGNPIYFNITHTREAFAIAVSKDLYVGIDLEDTHQDIDIHAIAKSFFSEKECRYIFQSESEARDRFFLLWTRKEALLKSLGTGIINNLNQVELYDHENIIKKRAFGNLDNVSTCNEHFIYSKRFLSYYLSIATPSQASFNYIYMKPEGIISYLTDSTCNQLKEL
jgi:4'-phosphopantetheinyl transferase